jgi:GTPase SAR1 family protein
LKSKKNYINIYTYENSTKSFESIHLWIKELKQNSSPDTKIFLIGNKADLEESRVIQKEQGEKLKEDYGIEYFIEASAKTGFNVQEIFVKAAKILFQEYITYNNIKRKEEKIYIMPQENRKNNNNGSRCC